MQDPLNLQDLYSDIIYREAEKLNDDTYAGKDGEIIKNIDNCAKTVNGFYNSNINQEEAEKEREFKADEAEKDREFKADEAEKEREFKADEAEKERNFNEERDKKERKVKIIIACIPVVGILITIIGAIIGKLIDRNTLLTGMCVNIKAEEAGNITNISNKDLCKQSYQYGKNLNKIN